MPFKDQHETKFFSALKDIFVGAKIEGDSGFINLMAIKSRYYQAGVFPVLKKDIDHALLPFPEFREELFDKLYTFFQRYFSESGSIYFRYTSLHQNVYEKVYTDDRDVILFWKTHMLYYVKTDRIFRSVAVEVEGTKFFFDASKMSLKKSNEKREVIYEFRKLQGQDGTLIFDVDYSERGRVTKMDEILKETKKVGLALNEDTLSQAFRIFEKQSEVDFFINKDARAFLQEQFDLWLYQYLFAGQNVWSEARLAQLQALKAIAYKVIDFISQFEDELVKIWNKPKFVRNSHYVLTLDKLGSSPVLEKLLAHPNLPQQVQEWRDLGMVGEDFKLEMLTQKDAAGALLHPKYQYLPIDTKYFSDLELDILALFDDLDAALDGWLVHSENYQALNNLLNKFNKKIQTIYIDPPFNTGNDFDYVDNYQDSTWLSIMRDRINIAALYLNEKGSFFCHLDTSANYYGRVLLENEFNGQFLNEIVWHYSDNFQGNVKGFANNHDIVLWYAKNKSQVITNKVMIDLEKPKKRDKRIWSKEDQKLIAARDEEGNIIYSTFSDKKADDVWVIGQSSTTKSQSKEFIDFNTQKPEEILRRIIYSSTTNEERDLILDFYMGTGTTIAVAQKMKKKWIGVEMGEHFYSIVLPRIKKVFFGVSSGISKHVDYSGGGFLKYYDLEQYEDVLRRAHYADAGLFHNPYEDPYHSYVFLRDLKMLDSVEIDEEGNKAHFHPERLYPDIDLAETLSQRRGKWIKRITADYVEFQDGERMSLTDPDWQTIKPLVWW